MVDATHISFKASDRSYYAILKRDIKQIAVEAGFSEQKVAELDIVLAEITSNLSKYANGGEILAGYSADEAGSYIEVICIDEGPGIANLSAMMKDGMSTSNTMGHGLGSIKRFSDVFDIYTIKGWGTILLSRIYKDEMPDPHKHFNVRSLVVSKPGERVSGDGAVFTLENDKLKILAADGLGHGPEANKAVNEAAKAFNMCLFDDPADIIRYIHEMIKRTRGIVATVIVADLKARKGSICGIGNIATSMLGFENSKSYIAYNGIVGHNIPRVFQAQQFSFDTFHELICCSDGIKSKWDKSVYPMISKHDPIIRAAAIYKDHARRTDDMSVLISNYK